VKNLSLYIFFLSLFLYSCSKDEIKIEPDNLLIGIWNYSDYQDNASIFTRSQEFVDNHCYRFNPDGTFLERKNAGWCGTPPISYADYPGTWNVLNDTLIQINVGYWGGSTSYRLDIESISSKSLKVVTIPDAK
jgi:hypothetical protein